MTAPRAWPTESAVRASTPTNDSSSATASGAMHLDETGHGVEDRLQTQLRAFGRGRFPPPVVDGPEAPFSFVDDAVPARGCPWIDADDLHGQRLGIATGRILPGMPGDIWLTFPDGTEHELKESVTIGRDAVNDLTFESQSVSREHAALMLRDGRWYVEDRGSFNGTFLNGTRVQPGARCRCDTPTGSASAPRRCSSPGRLSCRTRTRPSRSRRSAPSDFRAAVFVPATGRPVPVRAVARRCEPREPAVERTDRRAARHARRDGHRQGGTPPHLCEGRPLRPARPREAAGPLPRRSSTRLGLRERREELVPSSALPSA